VAYLAKKLGLRVLLILVDNKWNAEIADRNVDKTKFDIYRSQVDWEEFRDMQKSYLKSSVIDIEVLSDHAIVAVLYRLAVEKGIKYILSGTNVAT